MTEMKRRLRGAGGTSGTDGAGGNIVLIGMPGAGKSTVGPMLARKLGYGFVDTDEIIKNADGRALKDIVAEDGYERFLDIQKKIIMSARFAQSVIATGGSVVMSDELMRYFMEAGKIIYLKEEPAVLEQRLKPGRRLARAYGQTFRQLYEEREPLYARYADHVVDCSGKTPDKIVREILHKCRI